MAFLKDWLKRSEEPSLREKCEREMEVKYTRLLTRDFCLGWLSVQSILPNQKCALITQERERRSDGVFELVLNILESQVGSTDYISIRCCSIYALEVEVSLLMDLQAGNGVCVFEK